ncbi:MAG TPA: DM13 domain-containing protein [Acidimicrobiia bacterium]
MIALRVHRWYEALPEVVLGIGLSWFFVDQTDAATSAFKSGRAVALMAAGAIGWVVARVTLARFVRWPAARMLVLGGAALAVLAVVVLPAYQDDTVVETFPAAVNAGVSPAEEPAASQRPVPDPVLLRSGSLRGIDHEASGTVNIHRRADGRHVVGLEDFDVQPGPDYDVYLVPGSDRRDRAGGTRLDDLRGNRGTQFYDVPEELALGDGPWTVLIWCQTFGVPVAHGTPV